MYQMNSHIAIVLEAVTRKKYLTNVCVISLPQSAMVPSSITFNWRKFKDKPEDMRVYGQPVIAINGKVYVRGKSRGAQNVLEYTPGYNQWTELPHPPVHSFTIATRRSQLLLVGGRDKSNRKMTSTILTIDEHSRRWIQSHPAMPTALTNTAIIGYQDHAGGRNSEGNGIVDVNILNTTSNKWKTAQLTTTQQRWLLHSAN